MRLPPTVISVHFSNRAHAVIRPIDSSADTQSQTRHRAVRRGVRTREISEVAPRPAPTFSAALLRHRRLVLVALFQLGVTAEVQASTRGADSVAYDQLVDTRIGARGKGAARDEPYREAGHTFPGAMYPFGMVQLTTTYFAPQLGFVVNQYSGTGCDHMGNFPTRPMAGVLAESPADMRTLSFSYRLRRGISRLLGTQIVRAPNDMEGAYDIHDATAGYYRATIASHVDAELTVSPRGGMVRYSVRPDQNRLTIIVGAGVNSTTSTSSHIRFVGKNVIHAVADGGTFCGAPANYKVYLAAEFDAVPVATGTWSGTSLAPSAATASGANSGAYLTFDVSKERVVRYRFAISYVSTENAQRNLAAELPSWDFDALHAAASRAWNSYLSRIEVRGGSESRRRQFYTHLYHSLAHPSIASDVNGEYMGGDSRVHVSNKGQHHYTGFSNWDAYRAQIQLLSLLAPDIASDIVTSILDFSTQAGNGFPRWVLANVETGVMLGDPTSILVANAYAFGATRFDKAAALMLMRRGAEQPGTKSQGRLTRPLLSQYLSLGFVPGSLQLEYASADFAIGQFALQAFGDSGLHASYMRRATSWKRLYDPRTRWLRSRKRDGSWERPSDDWLEASYKTYFWMVPHDLKSLIDTIGGSRAAEARLDTLFARLNAGYYDEWYATGNEPGFAIPWTYNWVGAPYKTQAIVRRILREQFHDSDDGLPGNDDMGAMGAWYVFASLGLYPVVPGVGGFSLSSPLFPEIRIRLGMGETVTLVGGDERSDFIQALRAKGTAVEKTWLTLSEWIDGGRWEYTLGARPNQSWGSKSWPTLPSATQNHR